MSKTLQLLGGTTDKVDGHLGAERELVIDTDKKQICIQTGIDIGGIKVPTRADIDSKIENETITKLELINDELRFTDERGNVTVKSLSDYKDNTNLSRIVSGSVDAAGILTLIRDDDSSFTIDLSAFINEPNTATTDSLTSTSTDTVVSARQGKVIKDITDAKMDLLVSGTDVKTINGESLMGSGNMNIMGGATGVDTDLGKLYKDGELFVNADNMYCSGN